MDRAMDNEPMTLDQFHAYLRCYGYDVPRESQVLQDLYSFYQSGQWGEWVHSEFGSAWVWYSQQARHLLEPFARIEL